MRWFGQKLYPKSGAELIRPVESDVAAMSAHRIRDDFQSEARSVRSGAGDKGYHQCVATFIFWRELPHNPTPYPSPYENLRKNAGMPSFHK